MLSEEIIKNTQVVSHYENYLNDMQWIEAMQEIITPIEPGLELMVRKYLDRKEKDDRLQELFKAKFYLDLMIARRISGDSVRVDRVQAVIKSFLTPPVKKRFVKSLQQDDNLGVVDAPIEPLQFGSDDSAF